MDRPDVLLESEIEAYVEALEQSSIEELGSYGWMDKHDRIEKLTLQAIVQALSNREETVKEILVNREKLPILIHDLILTELWRTEIFPKLLKANPIANFGLYTVLYHEATCINLIETVLFHPEATETLGDSALDMTDYCLRSLNNLISNTPKEIVEYTNAIDIGLDKHSALICFRIAVKAITCLRYLIENVDKINSSVIPRMIITSDTPMVLVETLLQKPWVQMDKKTNTEVIYDLDEQRWKPFNSYDFNVVGKIEAQVWLALYSLFKHSRVINSYEIHGYRKNKLLQLRSMLNEAMIDQIPILGEFQRWLHEISLHCGPIGPDRSPFILEMLPPFRTALEAEFKEKEKKIIDLHIKELVNLSSTEMTAKAKRLASTYDFEAFEAVMPPAKCAACGEPATKRCGRCRGEWYCKRQCQVQHWIKHKAACNMSTAATKDE